MRVFLANVGSNSSHRQLVSPLFQDGTFEFLPIPEGNSSLDGSISAVHYRDLRSHYNPDQNLLHYAPEALWDKACHNDPDFQAFTYGDNGTNGRSSALTHMRKGTYYFSLPGWTTSLEAKELDIPGSIWLVA